MPTSITRMQADPDIPFVDRLDEMDVAVAAMHAEGVRLLTITGVAGVGKTRFATALSERLAPSFPDGTVAIDLAPLRAADQLDTELARALGVQPGTSGPLAEELDRILADRRALLFLDNAEHLLDIGDRVMRLLAASPGSRMIVTSRHRLDLSIELELPLDPLPVATEQEIGPASELFLAVAGHPDPHALDQATLAAVQRLCARLDGVPLAIELVAARVPSLAPAVLDRIATEPDTLGDTGSDVRLALRHAVNWSYRLLAPDARQLLRYLTVFADPFSVELVEALLDAADRPEAHRPAVELVDELASHHLIVPAAPSPGGSPRFRLPVIVAAVAGQALEHRGEDHDARRAHAAAMTEFATPRQFSGLHPGRELEVAELLAHAHNFRAALEWLRDHDDGDALLTLVARLSWYWYAQGFYTEGRAWFEEVLRRDPPPSHPLLGQLLMVYGILLDLLQAFEAARGVLDRAWDLHTRAGNDVGRTATATAQGIVAFHQGRHSDADRWLTRAIDIAMLLPDEPIARALEGIAWENLGASAHQHGRLEDAELALRQAIAIHERSGYRWGSARAHCDLGNLLRDTRELPGALAAAQTGIRMAHELGDRRLLAAGLAAIATILTEDNQPQPTAWLWGVIDTLLPAVSEPSLLPINITAYTRSQRIARRGLGVVGYTAAFREGTGTALDAAVRRASELTLTSAQPLRIPTEIAVTLTNRERDVLDLVAQGITTETIATSLGITERTVSSHIGALLRKFGVTSRLELISTATQGRDRTDFTSG